MARACVFCGALGRMSREHVLPAWLADIGIDQRPVLQVAGRLNRSPQQWTGRPFTSTVRSVCQVCNNGWLAKLEEHAKPPLTALILGEPQQLSPADQGLVAAWAHKTALVAMMGAASDGASSGDALPSSEYAAIYEQRGDFAPLPRTQCWIGTYGGAAWTSSIWVTPLAIEIDNSVLADGPVGYVFTVTLGRAIVQGVRFPNPLLAFDISNQAALSQAWPTQSTQSWPSTTPVDDDALTSINRGDKLTVKEAGFRIGAWKIATELPRGELVGTKIATLTPCGRHQIFYPAVLAHDAARHSVYAAFMTACECPKAYLLITAADGVHFRGEGTPDEVEVRYEALGGTEFTMDSPEGTFIYKQLS
jgi:hypothetical protein